MSAKEAAKQLRKAQAIVERVIANLDENVVLEDEALECAQDAIQTAAGTMEAIDEASEEV